jgi:pyrimidine-nucleoside phosphorylase
MQNPYFMNTETMRRLVERKRDGGRIAADEWHELVAAFTRGTLDEAQMAALAMACVFRGLDLDETIALTAATIDSGERIDLGIDGFVLDKHSSGGVGDTVSLIVVPLVAACGVPVAKVSGRALGHTGGTLDKLEAIPGVRTDLDPPSFAAIVREIGCAISAQSDRLVPADRKLYALRDRTGTVPSPGLIAASIVSKKIAAGADGIVYDVKCGRGAFVPDAAGARALAQTLVDVTERFERRAAVVISDMNEPLGPVVGAGLEAIEARDFLRGDRCDPRLREVVTTIAARMLELAALDPIASTDALLDRLAAALSSGRAYERFVAMIEAQGGTRNALESLGPASSFASTAAEDGYVRGIDAVSIGELAREIEARGVPCAGVRIAKRIGDRAERGEPLAFIVGGTEAQAHSLAGTFELGTERVAPRQPIVETVSGSLARSTSATR